MAKADGGHIICQPPMTLQERMMTPPRPPTKPLKVSKMRPAERSENLQRHCSAFPASLKNAAEPRQEEQKEQTPTKSQAE
ncbi:uncharacterized protein DMAD_00701 [Drosophila madeirensis]|uniref:Uncharacterized protein n=1 Tax=Drosophila madeirensis TaxID=30013 RepID=A0AAU9FYU8_DROMD